MQAVRKCLQAVLLLGALLPSAAWAIAFTEIFTAGDGRDGALAPPSDALPAGEKTVYVRFVYRDARPGETLRAHWHLVRDGEGRSGEFATTELRLEKAADLGQFSYTADPGFPAGHYRVEVRDERGAEVASVAYTVGDIGPQAVGQGPDGAGPARPAPASAAPIDSLEVVRVFTAGRARADRFPADEAVVHVRLEHRDAQPGGRLTAVWRHLGTAGSGGIGAFALADLPLESPDGRAEFSFRPRTGEGWLPGAYRVEVFSGPREVARADFGIDPVVPGAPAGKGR
jgi:hypothetical protein